MQQRLQKRDDGKKRENSRESNGLKWSCPRGKNRYWLHAFTNLVLSKWCRNKNAYTGTLNKKNQPNQVRILTPFWRQFQTKRQNEMEDSEVPGKKWRPDCRRLKRFRIGIARFVVCCCYSGCCIKKQSPFTTNSFIVYPSVHRAREPIAISN